MVTDHERAWREKRAALVATHDDGAISTLEDAIAGNAETECMAYCYGGTPKVDVYETLADLAEEGWRLVRADTTTVYTPREHADHFGYDLLDALKHPERYLSAEEIAEYERCQQSVIDARRSAARNEGQEMIG